MKFNSLVPALVLFGATATAQLKIGDNPGYIGPSAILEIESNNKAMVLPRVANTAAVLNPANGMLVYDLSVHAVVTYQNGYWGALAAAAPAVWRVNCDDTGFTGSINSGIGLSGAAFVVRVHNNTATSQAVSFSASNVSLSGVSGITVGTPSPASSTIAAGSSTLVTYPLTGTPASIGTLSAAWNLTLAAPASTTLGCSSSRQVGTGSATPRMPQIRHVGSATSYLGVIDNTTNKITIQLPYTAGGGSYAAYASAPVEGVAGQGGDTNSFRITYPQGTFSSSGLITATLVVEGDGVYSVKAQTDGAEQSIVKIPILINGEYRGDVEIKASGLVKDSYNNAYFPMGAPDGKTWLNNNLGAQYAIPTHAAYDPRKQANSTIDFNAFGSLFQWGRKADGHERVTWNIYNESSTFWTTTKHDNPPADYGFIRSTNSPYDWRINPDGNLWNSTGGVNNPCPTGYRVPTLAELKLYLDASLVTNTTNLASSTLKLPAPTVRSAEYGYIGDYTYRGTDVFYWTSTAGFNGSGAQRIISSSARQEHTEASRASGYPVRCIRNTN